MESYYFIFKIFAYLNTFLLLIYSILSIIVLRTNCSKIIKIVALYLMCSSSFDLIALVVSNYFPSNLITLIAYRLCELLIIGYLINKFWLKSKLGWFLICLSGSYLVYDLFTWHLKGVLSYEAKAQTAAVILLVGLIVANLLKQLRKGKEFSVTNQMLSMVFLAYFSIHLIYTVIQNFILNQSFTDKGFAMFYTSYAILHILYYAALGFILFRNLKTPELKL